MNKINLSADSSKLLLSYEGQVLNYPLDIGLLIRIFNDQPVVVVEQPGDNIAENYDQVKLTEGKLMELFYDREKKYTYLVGELDLVIGEPAPLSKSNEFIVKKVSIVEPNRNCFVVDFEENILQVKKGANGNTAIFVLKEKQSTGSATNGTVAGVASRG